jgi:hypothetical protein
VAEITPPLFQDVDFVYSGDELGLPHREFIGEGVLGRNDLRVSQRGAGANMSVDIAAGSAYVMGKEQLFQPNYRIRSDSVVNKAIATADATNPRIDQVIAEVLDATFSGASRLWQLRVVTGTPTSGATLDNRTGVGALGNNQILLADVLVGAAVSSIVDANIRGRRPFAIPSVIPPILTDVDMVCFQAAGGQAVGGITNISVGFDNFQSAILMYLPRRIVAATKIRWRYGNASPAATSNYVFAIFDASGRKIIDTGAIAFAGGANTFQERSETITATTFETGAYYVFFGIAPMTTSAQVGIAGFGYNNSIGANQHSIRNVALRLNSGGTTVPTTLLGFTDMAGTTTAATQMLPVPLVALSVG